MAAKGSALDKYANIAAINVAETVAGTTAYAKFNFPFSIMDKMAILISRIEYTLGALNQLNSSGDLVYTALTCSGSVSTLDSQNDPLILDSMRLLRFDLGAAASGFFFAEPIVKDFSQLPGGGILCAPAPLYAAIQSSGAGGAMSAWVRLYYTYMELSADDYWQLVESRRIISS